MDVVEAEKPVGVLVTFGGQTPLKLAQGARGGGRAHPGHEARGDRPGRGPRALPGAARPARHRVPGRGHGAARSTRPSRSRGRIGLPAARPARATCSAAAAWSSRTTRSTCERYMAEAVARLARPPRAARQVPRGRDRGRRRRGLRRRRRLHRRRHGAHRGGRHPLGRLGVLHPAVLARRGRSSSEIRQHTRTLALELGVHGPHQHPVRGEGRATSTCSRSTRARSRTVPFVSKATGVPLAKVAARVMAGEKLADDGPAGRGPRARPLLREGGGHAVRPVPRRRLACSGPEMKSTGEVMGSAADFPAAYAKSQLAIEYSLPHEGAAFISVCDRDKRAIVPVARQLHSSASTSSRRRARRARCARRASRSTEVLKVHEGRPNIVDAHHERRGAARHQHAVRPGDALRRVPHPHGGDQPRRQQHHDDRGRAGVGRRPSRRSRSDRLGVTRAAGLRRVGAAASSDEADVRRGDARHALARAA